MSSDSLPTGWAMARIDDVADKGVQRKPDETEMFTYVDIGSIDREKKLIRDPQALEGKDAPSRARKVINTGDVLVSLTRPNLNAVALVGSKFDDQIASTGFEVLKPNGIDSDLLFALVRSSAFVDSISGKVQGALYPAAKSADVRAFEFPLPPTPEQKQIAAKLDELLAQVDSIKTRLDAIPAILKRFRQSVLAAAVSGRLTEDWRAKLGIEQWSSNELSTLDIAIQIGPFGSLLHKRDYIVGGVPLVNPMHIMDGQIHPSESMTVSEDKANELARYRLEVGDVILGRRGEMGRASVVTRDGLLCGTGSLYLRPNPEEYLSEFLQIFLSSPNAIKQLEAGSVGSTMTNLNQKVLKNLLIPKVSIEEQKQIVSRVNEYFTLTSLIERGVVDGDLRVEKLSQSILAKAFRGDLTTEWREQNFDLIAGKNSAESLLRRIQEEQTKVPVKKQTRKRARA